MSSDRDYVLGTHDAEIERLGLQHRVWLPRASAAWRRAGFAPGQTLLDVGCGPGWATLDLAGVVGPSGRVIGLDRSRRFLDALATGAHVRGLANVETREADLDVDALGIRDADGAWSRWVYSFVREPRQLLERVVAALRPGGSLVFHEYVDYRAFRLAPRSEAFEAFVAEVMASWRADGGEPDIALELPRWLGELGCEVRETTAISECTRPGDPVWAWPRTFVDVGLRRLVDLGRVDETRADAMLRAFAASETTPGAFLMTPMVLEIIAIRR